MAGNYSMASCMIDFTQVPDGVKITDHFPETAAYPEFMNITHDREIKIAIAISDIESPFRKIKDPNMRLRALFEFLGISTETEEMQLLYDQVLSYKHDLILAVCCRYIQMINNHDYSIWWTLNLSFYDLQKESVIPRKDDEDVKKYTAYKILITNEMHSIGERLKKYEAVIFGDVKLKQAMVDQELKKISFFPEKMAEIFVEF